MAAEEKQQNTSTGIDISDPFNHWEVLKLTSRTFYLSIKKLPGILSESICLSYLILRISDFFEDNSFMSTDEKVNWLNQWEEVLLGGDLPEGWEEKLEAYSVNDPDAYAAYRGYDIIEKFNQLPKSHRDAILPHVLGTTRGMARWVVRGPDVQDEEDMDDYMHEVAGRVGYLVTDIFSLHSKTVEANRSTLMPLARETGLALQTVNIIRGLRKDFERGWIFVPESFCNTVGVLRKDLFKDENQGQALEVLNMLTAKAERHLASALVYLKTLPVTIYRVRLAVIWPVLFAARTLAISRENYKVFTGEVKMQRQEVKDIIQKTSLIGWSNHFLEQYYENLMEIH